MYCFVISTFTSISQPGGAASCLGPGNPLACLEIHTVVALLILPVQFSRIRTIGYSKTMNISDRILLTRMDYDVDIGILSF